MGMVVVDADGLVEGVLLGDEVAEEEGEADN